MSYLCRNGHLVRHNYQAGLDCAKCKANEQRRIKNAEKRVGTKAAAAIETALASPDKRSPDMTQSIPQTLPDSREAFEAYLDSKVHKSDVAPRRDLWPFSDTRPIHSQIFEAGWQAALASQPLAVAAIPEGMALLPREPDRAMLEACLTEAKFQYGHGITMDSAVHLYRAMVAAAPQPLAGRPDHSLDVGKMIGEATAAGRGGWQPIETVPEHYAVLVFTRLRNIKIERAEYVRQLIEDAKLHAEECQYTHWTHLPNDPEAAK